MTTYIYFPAVWNFECAGRAGKPTDGIGGPAVDDGGVLYAYKQYGPRGGDRTEFLAKTTLKEIVDEMIEGCAGRDSLVAPEHVPAVSKIQKALQDAADQLKAALPPSGA